MTHNSSPAFAVNFFWKDSALRGRIALPVIENVPPKMRDMASETLALPDGEAAALYSTSFKIHNS
jgi:hypothetical protein